MCIHICEEPVVVTSVQQVEHLGRLVDRNVLSGTRETNHHNNNNNNDDNENNDNNNNSNNNSNDDDNSNNSSNHNNPFSICASSLRSGHANILYVAPTSTDDPPRESRRRPGCSLVASDGDARDRFCVTRAAPETSGKRSTSGGLRCQVAEKKYCKMYGIDGISIKENGCPDPVWKPVN